MPAPPLESPKLAYVIESSSPTPIAAAFAEMRRREDDARDVQGPAGLLEATLRYLGGVVACEVLGLGGEDPGARRFAEFFRDEREGLGGLRRPPTAGKWA